MSTCIVYVCVCAQVKDWVALQQWMHIESLHNIYTLLPSVPDFEILGENRLCPFLYQKKHFFWRENCGKEFKKNTQWANLVCSQLRAWLID